MLCARVRVRVRVCALQMASIASTLANQKLSVLITKARTAGVSQEALDTAMDEENSKEIITNMLSGGGGAEDETEDAGGGSVASGDDDEDEEWSEVWAQVSKND